MQCTSWNKPKPGGTKNGSYESQLLWHLQQRIIISQRNDGTKESSFKFSRLENCGTGNIWEELNGGSFFFFFKKESISFKFFRERYTERWTNKWLFAGYIIMMTLYQVKCWEERWLTQWEFIEILHPIGYTVLGKKLSLQDSLS